MLDAKAFLKNVSARRQNVQETKEKPQRTNGTRPKSSQNKENTLPHAPEAEKAILAILLQHPETIAKAARSSNPFQFFFPTHREIFQTLVDVNDSGGRVGLIEITQILGDRGRLANIGGPSFLTELQTAVAVPESLDWFISVVREKACLREVISTGSKMIRAAHGLTDTTELPGMIDDFSRMVERIKQDAAGGRNGADRLDLDELEKFDAANDPNSLIGRRFLVRGGSWMIAGPTGCGKSSLLIQMAIHWSLGKPLFGMKPRRPLKVLIFQAEDDFGDVAEQDQGVIAGISDLGEVEIDRDLLRKNMVAYLARGISGGPFLEMLEHYVTLHQPDIVAINPFFAYAGCDILDPSIGVFLRDKLFSLGVKHGYCTLVMHHVSKPPRDGTDSGSTMYLGFGSSEVQNSFRAVSTISQLKESPGVWKLDFGKRRARAGATSPDGSLTDAIYMEHSKQGICWIQIKQPESEKSGPRREYSIDDVLVLMSFDEPIATSVLQKKLHAEKDMSRRTFFRLWSELQDSLMIEKREEKWVISAKVPKGATSRI